VIAHRAVSGVDVAVVQIPAQLTRMNLGGKDGATALRTSIMKTDLALTLLAILTVIYVCLQGNLMHSHRSTTMAS
jgi:hypothetical protein